MEQQPNLSYIFTFAYCGTIDDVFIPIILNKLATLAEPEKWAPEGSSSPFEWLYYYILKTFQRCYIQDKIVYSKTGEACVFNTGLVTEKAEDIYGLFTLNTNPRNIPNAQRWYLQGFFQSSSRDLSNHCFPNKPFLATYSDNPSDYYFDGSINIEFSSEHIFDERFDDGDRFPEDIIKLGKPLAISAIKDAFEISKIKVKRNHRLVVPQFYRGKMTYLMPLNVAILNDRHTTIALAIEKTPNGSYRANTIFSLKDAYKKARLITKPESNWLMEE